MAHGGNGHKWKSGEPACIIREKDRGETNPIPSIRLCSQLLKMDQLKAQVLALEVGLNSKTADPLLS